MPRARILATGRYVPERVVTNDDLAKMITTSDQWIRERTGVRERRFVKPGQGPTELAVRAVEDCLKNGNLTPQDIDFIIVATQTPEHFMPGTACFLERELGIPGVPALDVRCQCTGFLYGLSIADAYARLGLYKRILLVGTEVHSTGMEWTDSGRHITVLFGDGAGAVVIGPSEDDHRGILSCHLHADGRHAEELWVQAPGSCYSPQISHEHLEKGMQYAKMNGKIVFREAVTRMVEVVREALEANRLTASDIDHFIPHQANLRITEAAANMLGVPKEKTDTSIERYGNCAAASVPIALAEHVASGRIKPGDIVLFATFAAGFTWGAALLRW